MRSSVFVVPGGRRLSVVVAVIVAVVIVAVSAVFVSRTFGSSREPSSPSAGAIAVVNGFDACGDGWSGPATGGAFDFAVSNSTIAGEAVYLEGADDRKVYAEAEGLGPSSVYHLRVTLADGRYRFVCMPAGNDPIAGPVVTVRDSPAGLVPTPGIEVVTRADLLPAAHTYNEWVGSRIKGLARDAQRLATAIVSGDRAVSQAAWLTAQQDYSRLGAAYGAFGDLADAIDGDPAAGSSALEDSDLHGLRKIEALLWSDRPIADAAPVASRLIADIGSLTATLAKTPVNAIDLGLRSHEILEDAIQFTLTGADDAGSHTGLAVIAADIEATRAVLDPIRPLVTPRYAGLSDADAWLARTATLVASYKTGGTWRALDSLDRAQREALDADLERTVELLAPIAAVTDPRVADQ
ncbi:EfeM/EfeO family lipoprotein [Microbispora bryophytorum]|nr:EfeM/EfeO family lipoprotein [Microbispora bryophytorum]TQS01659.1 EfeM/EfeO family lipoprotein [Microbispora bryophytorum]